MYNGFAISFAKANMDLKKSNTQNTVDSAIRCRHTATH